MLVGLMAEMLKHFLQVNFDLVEGFDCIDPAPWLSVAWPFRMSNRRGVTHLGGCGGPSLTGVSGRHDGFHVQEQVGG